MAEVKKIMLMGVKTFGEGLKGFQKACFGPFSIWPLLASLRGSVFYFPYGLRSIIKNGHVLRNGVFRFRGDRMGSEVVGEVMFPELGSPTDFQAQRG